MRQIYAVTKNQDGVTLTELMIAIGILSTLILAMITVLETSTRQLHRLKLTTVRDDLNSQVRKVLADERNIRFSREQPTNTLFAECFQDAGEGLGDCLAQQEHPMYLYDQSGLLIAGPETNPVFYNYDGGRCTTDSPRCKIKVTVAVRPQGLPRWYNNQLFETPPYERLHHEILEIKYKISVETASTDLEFRPITGSLIMDTADWM